MTTVTVEMRMNDGRHGALKARLMAAVTLTTRLVVVLLFRGTILRQQVWDELYMATL